MVGTHCLKTWSINQAYIALSSGEAEYYGAVRGASQALGVKAMMKDMGVDIGVQVYIDASAAMGIASRRGMGRVRHIELNELWLQDQVARKRIKLQKVDGKENIADSLTKYCKAENIQMTMEGTHHRLLHGRHHLMPSI